MSICWASIAALARIINSAVVSLGVCIHSAQIRASTCLALASSGAAFSAPNRKSSPRARSGPGFGNLLGGSGNFFCCFGGAVPGSCANAAIGAAAISAARRLAVRSFRAGGNLGAMAKVYTPENALQSSKTSKTCEGENFRERPKKPVSPLARLEAALNLVDHVNPALATDQTVVAVTTTQRFQRVTDLHGIILVL